jgi:hypothetical protein
VTASGGIYVFKDREVPDTFHLLAEFPKGHSLVLSSSMANSQHIPGLIRGHEGSLVMVEHGRFEGYAPQIKVIPEKKVIGEAYKARFGENEIIIPVEETGAHAKLSGLHEIPSEAHARCGNRHARTGDHYNGRSVLSGRPDSVLGREEYESSDQAAKKLAWATVAAWDAVAGSRFSFFVSETGPFKARHHP